MILTLFYDSSCPLCNKEITQLKTYDKEQDILFEDINDATFTTRYPYIDKNKANAILHGQLSDGSMIYGLDVTCLAWKTVGKHQWLAVLRWPVIRFFADISYRFFARYRNRISQLFIASQPSDHCPTCKTDK